MQIIYIDKCSKSDSDVINHLHSLFIRGSRVKSDHNVSHIPFKSARLFGVHKLRVNVLIQLHDFIKVLLELSQFVLIGPEHFLLLLNLVMQVWDFFLIEGDSLVELLRGAILFIYFFLYLSLSIFPQLYSLSKFLVLGSQLFRSQILESSGAPVFIKNESSLTVLQLTHSVGNRLSSLDYVGVASWADYIIDCTSVGHFSNINFIQI